MQNKSDDKWDKDDSYHLSNGGGWGGVNRREVIYPVDFFFGSYTWFEENVRKKKKTNTNKEWRKVSSQNPTIVQFIFKWRFVAFLLRIIHYTLNKLQRLFTHTRFYKVS